MKIQFASGGNHLEGWLNLEQHNGDITKPLAFKDNSVDFIFIEHGLEHVTPQQGYKFLQEAFRVIKPLGAIRVIVPDITKIWIRCNDAYLSLLEDGVKTWYPAAGKSVPNEITRKTAVEALVYCHGHQSLYNESLLTVLLESVGFATWGEPPDYGKSSFPELNGIDSHHRYMGWDNCVLESCVLEGYK